MSESTPKVRFPSRLCPNNTRWGASCVVVLTTIGQLSLSVARVKPRANRQSDAGIEADKADDGVNLRYDPFEPPSPRLSMTESQRNRAAKQAELAFDTT